MSKEEYIKIQVCVLKVIINCDGCKKKIKKILDKIEGVYSTTYLDSEAEEGLVRVSGIINPATLINRLAKSGKIAEIWGGGGGRPTPQQQQQQQQPYQRHQKLQQSKLSRFNHSDDDDTSDDDDDDYSSSGVGPSKKKPVMGKGPGPQGPKMMMKERGSGGRPTPQQQQQPYQRHQKLQQSKLSRFNHSDDDDTSDDDDDDYSSSGVGPSKKKPVMGKGPGPHGPKMMMKKTGDGGDDSNDDDESDGGGGGMSNGKEQRLNLHPIHDSNLPHGGLQNMGGRGSMGQMPNMNMPMGQMGPMANKPRGGPMANKPRGGPMGSMPAVQGLQAGDMYGRGGAGYLQGTGPELMADNYMPPYPQQFYPYPYLHQGTHTPTTFSDENTSMANKPRGGPMGSMPAVQGLQAGDMYGRGGAGYLQGAGPELMADNYMPPYPQQFYPYPYLHQGTHTPTTFSDENTSSCNVM